MTSQNGVPEDLECPSCRCTLRPGVHTNHVHRNGYHLIIDELPALICGQCGEPLFEGEAIDTVQSMLRTLDEQTRKLQAA